jgi:hypothetical protein
VPARAVVIPGITPKEFPAGTYGTPCALVIGERKASTDLEDLPQPGAARIRRAGVTEKEVSPRPSAPHGPGPAAIAAWVVLAALLHLRSLGAGFVETDLAAIATALRTNLDALLRGGAYPGTFAPLSRELYWWFWSRVVPLDAFAFHLLNAGFAIATGWWLYRAGERWGGPTAGIVAGMTWTAFAPTRGLAGFGHGRP